MPYRSKFRADLQAILTREQGFEAVMRIRCSAGLAVSTYYGNFTLRGNDLMHMPMVDADKAFAIELRLEENATNVHLLTHHTVQVAVSCFFIHMFF